VPPSFTSALAWSSLGPTRRGRALRAHRAGSIYRRASDSKQDVLGGFVIQRPRDTWDILSLGLWSIFFAVGLVPELAFYALREFGGVSTRTAFINTSAAITVSFTLYLAFFAWRRCLDAGLSRPESQVRALQVGLLALIAFLELPAQGASFQTRTLLEVLANFNEIPDRYLKMVVLFVGICKLAAWWYLFQVILRFYAFGNYRVFTNMPTLFSTGEPKASNTQRGVPPPKQDDLPGAIEPPASVLPPEYDEPTRRN
jgi:hypothetical protein